MSFEPQVCNTLDKDKDEPNRGAHVHAPRLDWLRTRYDRQRDDLIRCRRVETHWSALRLVVFAAGITAVIVLRHDASAAGLAGVVGVLVFAGAVWQHATWQNRRSFAEHFLTVLGESLHASTRRDQPARAWQRPEDPADSQACLPMVLETGPTWPLTAQEQDDLDLYGPPVGIFGLLNRTSTPLGARRLRDMLDSSCLSGAHIRQRQQAVQWLDTHDEQRLHLLAALVPLRERARHLDSLVSLLHRATPLPRSIVSKGVGLWSIFSGLILLYGVLRISSGDYVWISYLGMLLAVNIGIRLVLRRVLRERSALALPWTPLRDTLDHLGSIAHNAGTELPDEVPLVSLKQHFHTVATEARLGSLCLWLEWAGAPGMVRGWLNVVVFLDLHIAEAVLGHVAPNRDVLLRGLSALAELEALGSLACFSAEQPVACLSRTGRWDGSDDKGRLPSAYAGAGCHGQQYPPDAGPEDVGDHRTECRRQEHLPADGRCQCAAGPGRCGGAGGGNDVVARAADHGCPDTG